MSTRPQKDLVFIASGGRTGTTFFGEILGRAIPSGYSVHEPDVLGEISLKTLNRIRRFGVYHMVIGKMIGATGLRSLGHRLLAGGISEEDCIRRLRQMRASYHRSINAPLILESSGRWWMLANVVGRAWPGAKMIGVIRDPRNWIESWRRHQPMRHRLLFPRWLPQGPLKPGDTGDTEWVDRWDELDSFGRLAWDWRAITMHLDRVQSESKNVRVYRFEEIFAQDNATFTELVAFCAEHGDRRYETSDLDGLLSEVHNASSGKRRAWQDWPRSEVQLVDEMCGPLMRKYGYGLEPDWLEMTGEKSGT